MKTLIITLALYCAGLCVAQQEANYTKQFDDFLKLEYPKHEPGAVVLIAKEGKVIFKKAYGLASLKPKRKMKDNMIFPIASMTKQFTSAAILQLIEEGKMNLDDPIQKYVPYYPEKAHPISIHHLLSQTSGIPEYFDVDEEEFSILAKDYTPKQIIAYYTDFELQFEPGTQFQYSNSNYPLLGAALEKVTGMSLRDYMQQQIFDPLGMISTGLWYRNDVKQKDIATGYYIKDGKFKTGPTISSSALYAPGGMVSTVDDLYKWYLAMRSQKGISDYVYTELTTEKTLINGEGSGYGYGFFLRELQGSPTIEHGGNLFSYTSQGIYLPEEDVFVCILSNTSFDRVQKIAYYFASVLLDDPIVIFSKKTVSVEMLEEYTGIYELQHESIDKTLETILYDNQLVLHDPKAPQNSALLEPVKKDFFVVKNVGAKLQFNRDENDTIVGYSVQQGEEIFEFIKVD